MTDVHSTPVVDSCQISLDCFVSEISGREVWAVTAVSEGTTVKWRRVGYNSSNTVGTVSAAVGGEGWGAVSAVVSGCASWTTWELNKKLCGVLVANNAYLCVPLWYRPTCPMSYNPLITTYIIVNQSKWIGSLNNSSNVAFSTYLSCIAFNGCKFIYTFVHLHSTDYSTLSLCHCIALSCVLCCAVLQQTEYAARVWARRSNICQSERISSMACKGQLMYSIHIMWLMSWWQNCTVSFYVHICIVSYCYELSLAVSALSCWWDQVFLL